jgi:predicted transcriptional regulator
MKDKELMAAAAQIAAAKIAGNPSLKIDDVVREAIDSLRHNLSHQLTAAEVEVSVKPDYIICFEDNTKHTMLRRYLKRKYNMSPEEYKSKWGLPDNYPMTATGYSKTRSKLARRSGLGLSSRRVKTA